MAENNGDQPPKGHEQPDAARGVTPTGHPEPRQTAHPTPPDDTDEALVGVREALDRQRGGTVKTETQLGNLHISVETFVNEKTPPPTVRTNEHGTFIIGAKGTHMDANRILEGNFSDISAIEKASAQVISEADDLHDDTSMNKARMFETVMHISPDGTQANLAVAGGSIFELTSDGELKPVNVRNYGFLGGEDSLSSNEVSLSGTNQRFILTTHDTYPDVSYYRLEQLGLLEKLRTADTPNDVIEVLKKAFLKNPDNTWTNISVVDINPNQKDASREPATPQSPEPPATTTGVIPGIMAGAGEVVGSVAHRIAERGPRIAALEERLGRKLHADEADLVNHDHSIDEVMEHVRARIREGVAVAQKGADMVAETRTPNNDAFLTLGSAQEMLIAAEVLDVEPRRFETIMKRLEVEFAVATEQGLDPRYALHFTKDGQRYFRRPLVVFTTIPYGENADMLYENVAAEARRRMGVAEPTPPSPPEPPRPEAGALSSERLTEEFPAFYEPLGLHYSIARNEDGTLFHKFEQTLDHSESAPFLEDLQAPIPRLQLSHTLGGLIRTELSYQTSPREDWDEAYRRYEAYVAAMYPDSEIPDFPLTFSPVNSNITVSYRIDQRQEDGAFSYAFNPPLQEDDSAGRAILNSDFNGIRLVHTPGGLLRFTESKPGAPWGEADRYDDPTFQQAQHLFNEVARIESHQSASRTESARPTSPEPPIPPPPPPPRGPESAGTPEVRRRIERRSIPLDNADVVVETLVNNANPLTTVQTNENGVFVVNAASETVDTEPILSASMSSIDDIRAAALGAVRAEQAKPGYSRFNNAYLSETAMHINADGTEAEYALAGGALFELKADGSLQVVDRHYRGIYHNSDNILQATPLTLSTTEPQRFILTNELLLGDLTYERIRELGLLEDLRTASTPTEVLTILQRALGAENKDTSVSVIEITPRQKSADATADPSAPADTPTTASLDLRSVLNSSSDHDRLDATSDDHTSSPEPRVEAPLPQTAPTPVVAEDTEKDEPQTPTERFYRRIDEDRPVLDPDGNNIPYAINFRGERLYAQPLTEQQMRDLEEQGIHLAPIPLDWQPGDEWVQRNPEWSKPPHERVASTTPSSAPQEQEPRTAGTRTIRVDLPPSGSATAPPPRPADISQPDSKIEASIDLPDDWQAQPSENETEVKKKRRKVKINAEVHRESNAIHPQRIDNELGTFIISPVGEPKLTDAVMNRAAAVSTEAYLTTSYDVLNAHVSDATELQETVLRILPDGNHAEIGNVGGKVYRVTNDGSISEISIDDTIMTAGDTFSAKPHVTRVELSGNDRFILVTGDTSDTFNSAVIEDTLRGKKKLKDAQGALAGIVPDDDMQTAITIVDIEPKAGLLKNIGKVAAGAAVLTSLVGGIGKVAYEIGQGDESRSAGTAIIATETSGTPTTARTNTQRTTQPGATSPTSIPVIPPPATTTSTEAAQPTGNPTTSATSSEVPVVPSTTTTMESTQTSAPEITTAAPTQTTEPSTPGATEPTDPRTEAPGVGTGDEPDAPITKETITTDELLSSAESDGLLVKTTLKKQHANNNWKADKNTLQKAGAPATRGYINPANHVEQGIGFLNEQNINIIKGSTEYFVLTDEGRVLLGYLGGKITPSQMAELNKAFTENSAMNAFHQLWKLNHPDKKLTSAEIKQRDTEAAQTYLRLMKAMTPEQKAQLTEALKTDDLAPLKTLIPEIATSLDKLPTITPGTDADKPGATTEHEAPPTPDNAPLLHAETLSGNVFETTTVENPETTPVWDVAEDELIEKGHLDEDFVESEDARPLVNTVKAVIEAANDTATVPKDGKLKVPTTDMINLLVHASKLADEDPKDIDPYMRSITNDYKMVGVSVSPDTHQEDPDDPTRKYFDDLAARADINITAHKEITRQNPTQGAEATKTQLNFLTDVTNYVNSLPESEKQAYAQLLEGNTLKAGALQKMLEALLIPTAETQALHNIYQEYVTHTHTSYREDIIWGILGSFMAGLKAAIIQ